MSKWVPYEYQLRVSELILSGKSVILQAPTGAGKTAAALLPFLHANRQESGDGFPTKCVYSVPMRVLANQFVLEYQKRAASFSRRYRQPLRVEIQTGEQSNDRCFESDLIFCTIDQFLSSFLLMPYSLPKTLANLNAGAMVGSYLVFDEFHLLDPGSTLGSTLYTIKKLGRVAPVLLMTATFSTSMLQTLAKLFQAEVVLVSAEEATRIERRDRCIVPRQRTWMTAKHPISAESILDEHHKRSLVLCNTIKRAQHLYRDLQVLLRERKLDVRVILLHSRFLPGDRQTIEKQLRMLFGKEADKSGSVITVATQTIEVGLDISCETLHTELAPTSALIQRAGRCARYPGEQGRVIVYPVEKYAPYGLERNDSRQESDWVKEMKIAFGWLQENTGEIFDFAKEQEFVDAVATPRDRKVLEDISAGRIAREHYIHRVLEGDRSGQEQRLLVRDIDSRLVLVHHDPTALLEKPYSATGFNLQRSSLYGMVKGWLERGDALGLDWSVQRLLEDRDASEDNHTDYGWQPLFDTSLLAESQVFLVHSSLAGYLADEGFIADRGDTGFLSTISTIAVEQTWEGYSYRLESYEEHIRLVLEAFCEVVFPEIAKPAKLLTRAAGWPDGHLLRAAWLVCLLHDVGKLSLGWQSWARRYQKQIGEPMEVGFAAAHTHREWGNPTHHAADRFIQNRFQRPPHAGEGALIVAPLLVKLLGQNELTRAAISAITRHHSPFSRETREFILEAQAKSHIQSTFAFLPDKLGAEIDLSILKTEIRLPPDSFSNLMISPHEDFGWLAYSMLVRALRRSDQEGTKRGSI